jgi:two-component system sensor histidine kinase BaeS
LPLARVSVSDTGSGIDAADLPHIFDRFYRGSSEGEPRADAGASAGSQARRFGLGLAIAREIVSRHGGTIAVESAPGRGTTFTLDFPALQADGEQPDNDRHLTVDDTLNRRRQP